VTAVLGPLVEACSDLFESVTTHLRLPLKSCVVVPSDGGNCLTADALRSTSTRAVANFGHRS
jgi:hypothetical protein